MTTALAARHYHLQVTPTKVEFGLHDIPIGNVKKIMLPETKHFGTPYVTLLAEGAMGKKGKTVSLRFECKTVEKVKAFIHKLFKHTEASFPFYAWKMEDPGTTRKRSDQFERSVEISFEDDIHAQNFSTYMLPYFFPNADHTVHGRYLTLTLTGATDEAVSKPMASAMIALGKKTNGKAAILDLQELCLEPETLPIPACYYEISPESVKIKERGNQFMRLPKVTAEDIVNLNKEKDRIFAELTIKKVKFSEMDEWEARAKFGQPKTSVELHIMKNIAESLKDKN